MEITNASKSAYGLPIIKNPISKITKTMHIILTCATKNPPRAVKTLSLISLAVCPISSGTTFQKNPPSLSLSAIKKYAEIIITIVPINPFVRSAAAVPIISTPFGANLLITPPIWLRRLLKKTCI